MAMLAICLFVICVQALTVPAGAVTVTSITPETGVAGTTVSAEIHGTDFVNGASAKLTFTLGTIHREIVGTNVRVNVLGTRVLCDFALPEDAMKSPWAYSVRVTNPDSSYDSLGSAFTIYAPLSVTSITPATGGAERTVSTTIAGTGFQPGATVKLSRYVYGTTRTVTASNVDVVSSSEITCDLALPSTSTLGTLGDWDVVVTNADTVSKTLTDGFRIFAPLTVTGISPNEGGYGATVDVVITGTGFQPGATVQMTSFDAVPISATGVQVVSDTEIACTFHLWSSTSAPFATLTVYNPDGSNSLADEMMFALNPAPVVTSFSPEVGAQGATVSVTVIGSEFQTGATVELRKNMGSFDFTIPGTRYTYNILHTRITCDFVIPENAMTGNWNVYVTNPDGGEDGLGTFVIHAAPTVTSITPNSGEAGTTVQITNLAGTGFANGATVELRKHVGLTIRTIPATDVVVATGTQIVCTVVLPEDAQAGSWGVYVTNTDGGTGALAGGFTVVSDLPVAVPPGTNLPTDTNGDGLYDDINGNGVGDFADIVLYFNQMTWITANEPRALFDYNGNGNIDFGDVVWLFNHL